MGKASTSITISFGGEVSADPKDVVLTIKDYCNDAEIAGAVVTLTIAGPPPVIVSETSGADGKVTFLQVPPGTHALSISAAGYLPNTADSLANDSITV